jgi:hypothetical protein
LVVAAYTVVPELSMDARLHEIAERVAEEFRASLRQQPGLRLVPFEKSHVDALHDLLRRGVIEVGPGA